jgi:hypothetical protein
LRCQRPDRAVDLDLEPERLRIAIQVRDYLVTAGIALWVARKREARKAAVAAGREQRQRFPAVAPSGTNRIGRLQDYEPSARRLEEVPNRQSGLTRSDDDDLVVGARMRCGAWFALGGSHHETPFRSAPSETQRRVNVHRPMQQWAGGAFPNAPDLKVSFALTSVGEPINGLRHLREGDTTGRYLWRGDLSQADDDARREWNLQRQPSIERTSQCQS